MNALIIYKGKYGATRQYAEWLSEETGFPNIAVDNFDVKHLREFDTIIIGTSVYIGKLQIRKWLRRNWHELRDKKLYLFLVAGTPPDQKETLNGYIRSNVPKEILGRLSLTYLPGKLFLNELSGLDKFLIKIGSRAAEKKDSSQKIRVNYNNVKRENLKPLLEELGQVVMF